MDIEITNDQARVPVNPQRLFAAIQDILAAEGYDQAVISLAVVDDETIHALNLRYLNHDYPTDVLSFVLEQDEEELRLEGEIIVSADTAAKVAQEFEWSPEDELLLYVIHGALHLVGYDDKSAADAAEMRRAEAHFLRVFGLPPRNEEPSRAPSSSSASSRALASEGVEP